MGIPRRTRGRAWLGLGLGLAAGSAALACNHTAAPDVEDPFIVPPPTMRTEPFAAPRDAGGTCSPGDVSAFHFTWKPPQPLYQGVCTPAQAALLAGCIANGATSTCNTFIADATNRPCITCAYGETTGPKLPAVVDYRDWLVEVNYADCFANADGDLTADGCGAQIQARRACTVAACAGCSTKNQGDVPAEEACALQAEDTVCKEYTDRSVCEYDLINGPGKICRIPAGGALESAANKYILLFCGANPLKDAGPG